MTRKAIECAGCQLLSDAEVASEHVGDWFCSECWHQWEKQSGPVDRGPWMDSSLQSKDDWVVCTQCGTCSRIGQVVGERWFCRECWYAWEPMECSVSNSMAPATSATDDKGCNLLGTGGVAGELQSLAGKGELHQQRSKRRHKRLGTPADRKEQQSFKELIEREGGWETLARLYTSPNRLKSSADGTQPSVGFQLERKETRPKLRAYGAARQLIEESRSIFLNNLTNLVNSVAIAHQFFEKADEDRDGKVTRAQLRKWVKNMIMADAYAGLDHDREVAEIMAHALSTAVDFEMQVGPLLESTSRACERGKERGEGELAVDALPESWVRNGRPIETHSEESASEASEFSTNSATSTDTTTPTLGSSHDELDSGSKAFRQCGEMKVDPQKIATFAEFKRAVDALSLKMLLRTDGVRNEVPVCEEPGTRVPTLVADQVGPYPSLWDKAVEGGEHLRKSKVRKAWEDSYATGRNCIWVVPEADQDVRRALTEGWFETRGVCLELGCGLGYDAIAFAEAGFQVIGVDISQTAISAARAMARSKGLQERTRFLCEDAYALPTPTKPVALLWDNTLYQNAHRGDRLGERWKYNSSRYKELLLRLTVPGSLVMMNVMSSELTEGHIKLAERGFYLPFVSAMRLAMEFVEFFEFLFFRNGIYDMNSLFIHEASQIGYEKPALLGGLPSWCVLMRRRKDPRPYVPVLPAEEPFLVASRLLARDGFKKPTQPLFLRRLVEEEWGEDWGDGPKSGLMLSNAGDECSDENISKSVASPGELPSLQTHKECTDTLESHVDDGYDDVYDLEDADYTEILTEELVLDPGPSRPAANLVSAATKRLQAAEVAPDSAEVKEWEGVD